MASSNPHNMKSRPATEDELDKVEAKLKEMGCLDKHYEVLECIGDTKDWRKCQEQVAEFKKCYMSGLERMKKDMPQ